MAPTEEVHVRVGSAHGVLVSGAGDIAARAAHHRRPHGFLKSYTHGLRYVTVDTRGIVTSRKSHHTPPGTVDFRFTLYTISFDIQHWKYVLLVVKYFLGS